MNLLNLNINAAGDVVFEFVQTNNSALMIDNRDDSLKMNLY